MMADPESGTVAATKWQQVVAAVIAGAGVGWLIFAVPDRLGWPLPSLPLIASIALGGFAIVVGVLAGNTHRRIQIRREVTDPNRAVRLLVLGKTALIAGAALAAGYTSVIVYFLPHGAAELPRQRIVNSAIAVLGSVGLAIAGYFLERACRIPGPPSGDATPKNLPRTPVTPD